MIDLSKDSQQKKKPKFKINWYLVRILLYIALAGLTFFFVGKVVIDLFSYAQTSLQQFTSDVDDVLNPPQAYKAGVITQVDYSVTPGWSTKYYGNGMYDDVPQDKVDQIITVDGEQYILSGFTTRLTNEKYAYFNYRIDTHKITKAIFKKE